VRRHIGKMYFHHRREKMWQAVKSVSRSNTLHDVLNIIIIVHVDFFLSFV